MIRPIARITLAPLLAILAFPLFLHAQAGVAPKTLFDAASPNAPKQVAVNGGSGDQVYIGFADNKSLVVIMKAGEAAWPGIVIKPEDGIPWNLGLHGHVEAKVTNIGTRKLNLGLRVDNEGDYTKQPWNSEGKSIEPGQTKTLRVYFGYSYGYRPGFKLDPQAVTQLLFFSGKLSEDVAFKVEQVQGAGWPGEKIGLDPDRVARKPANGIILDANTMIQPAAQLGTAGGAQASTASGGRLLQLQLVGGKGQSITFRPAEGLWNLNEHMQVRVKLKNVGQKPITPAIRMESDAGPTDTITAAAPLSPGAQTEFSIPFAPKTPWKGVVTPATEPDKSWGHIPGSGTEYRSNVTTGITFFSEKPGALLVSSIVADCPPLNLPDWLGKRPPVEGDWVQTLNEEFDGNTIDPRRWNVHGPNWWDKRMHFSKDQIIVEDGMLKLRLAKKPGHHNDDPKGAFTDYAAGQIDSGGKWSQRYGYFEIREKQPREKCLWPGFWMVADGERKPGQNDGMEFDITESQSAWGIHRFNIACHWDGYEKDHKAIGTSSNYVQADKDGFITVGLLWLPGQFVVYGNGQEIYRWENPRISDRQELLIVQNQIGGWDNEEVDDSQLPADFLVDYIRVWQRKDLATPEDGPKPNKGGYDAFHEKLPPAEADR